MFPFFTSLADMYSKVLMPPKALIERLRRDADDKPGVLDRCLKRLEWERSQARCACKGTTLSHQLRRVTPTSALASCTEPARRRKTRRRLRERQWCVAPSMIARDVIISLTAAPPA